MADTTVTVDNVSTFKVADLKRELKVRGLAVSGNKTELVERLQSHLEEDAPEQLDSDLGDTSLALNDNSLTLNDTATDDSLLQDEKDLLGSPTKETPPEVPVVRQKITMSDGDGEKNGHESIKKPATSEEALKARSERFGVQSAEEKKESRAARFGITSTTTTTASKPSGKIENTPVTADDLEKLKKRAERFGTVVSTSLSKVADVEKLKQRSERFGAVVAPALSKVEEEEKIKKRKDRFGALSGGTTPVSSDEVEAKKRKRAERFGLS